MFSDPAADIISFLRPVLTWLQPAIWAIRWDSERKREEEEGELSPAGRT